MKKNSGSYKPSLKPLPLERKKSFFELTSQEVAILKAEIAEYMDEYWSVGLLRLVIDLWRRKTTCRLIEKMLKHFSKKHKLAPLDAIPMLAENLKPLLLEMGYEVTSSGVVNNTRSNKQYS